MNKEYKLIQKYPGLPLDWEIGMIVGMGDRNYGYSPCAGNYSDYRKLDNPEVENNPEFWVISIEQNYVIEILTHTNTDYNFVMNGSLFSPIFLNDLISSNNYDKTLIELLNDDWQVGSIKRTVDNEVFSIGDKAKTLGKYKSSHIIKSFEIRQKSITRNQKDGIDRIWVNWQGDEGGNWLEAIEKYVEPVALFTTLDNVEVFESDEFYIVNPDNYEITTTIAWYYTKTKPNYKRFKERINADDYVIHNKPVLTLNDVQNVLNGHLLTNNHIGIELDKSLLNLVKGKLNL